MRFTHIDVNFDVTHDGHQKPSKCFSESILGNFDDLHIWCQNWCQYLWTSLCHFLVNLLHSPDVWLFDIFLTTWHLLTFNTYNLNHLSPHRAIFYINVTILWQKNLLVMVRSSLPSLPNSLHVAASVHSPKKSIRTAEKGAWLFNWQNCSTSSIYNCLCGVHILFKLSLVYLTCLLINSYSNPFFK